MKRPSHNRKTNIDSETSAHYHKILKNYWGYSEFRPLQEEIIDSICNKQDTMGIMPTGGGKSLIFQVAALSQNGMCLVITPLIALMKDQVDRLAQMDISAMAIYGDMSHDRFLTILDNAVYNRYKFLYVSPERLKNEIFQQKLLGMNIGFIVVDEAHCIVQWGYDFRPSYMEISNLRELLPSVPILALTATATPRAAKTIQNNLQFPKENLFKTSFEQPNLSYSVFKLENKEEKLLQILTKVGGSSIVYVRSRQKTKQLSDFLNHQNISADYFHAGLPIEERDKKQKNWMNNSTRVIVSTTAFGMGIDKSDVRSVIHFGIPESIEAYYQEVGRAGRDRKKSYAVLLYSPNDKGNLKKKLTDEFPPIDFVINVYEHLAYYFQIAVNNGEGAGFSFDSKKFAKTYHFPHRKVISALKILTIAGYISYQDSGTSSSWMQMHLRREDLYDIDFEAETEELVKLLLRSYSGIFTDVVHIDEDQLAKDMLKTREWIEKRLSYLSKCGYITYAPRSSNERIKYLCNRIDKPFLAFPPYAYTERKKADKQRIEAIIDYLENESVCRSRQLLAYFEESRDKECQICDNCQSKKGNRLKNWQINDVKKVIDLHLIDQDYVDVGHIDEIIPDMNKQAVMNAIKYLIEHSYYKLDGGRLTK